MPGTAFTVAVLQGMDSADESRISQQSDPDSGTGVDPIDSSMFYTILAETIGRHPMWDYLEEMKPQSRCNGSMAGGYPRQCRSSGVGEPRNRTKRK